MVFPVGRSPMPHVLRVAKVSKAGRTSKLTDLEGDNGEGEGKGDHFSMLKPDRYPSGRKATTTKALNIVDTRRHVSQVTHVQ